MANYSDWVSYFKNLCVLHVDIKHGLNGAKKFFRLNIEELYSGIATSLPNGSEGPFFVFVNYISDYGQKGRAIKGNQMMFLILHTIKKGDHDKEEVSTTLCETVIEDFLKRMKYDSENGVAPFESDFDVIEAKKTSAKIEGTTSNYAGWQVTFNPLSSFNDCYDPAKFNTP